MLHAIRTKFLVLMYERSQGLYRQYFKRQQTPWRWTQAQLMAHPNGSLGKALGEFYEKHQLSAMPKLENHDVFHVLAHIAIRMQDEIALQYWLLGNGKLSVYQIGTIVLGSLVFPEHGSFYAASYFNGTRRRAVWRLDFEHLLGESVADFCSENIQFLGAASKVPN